MNFSTGEKVEQTNKSEQLTDRREREKADIVHSETCIKKGTISQLKLVHTEFREDA